LTADLADQNVGCELTFAVEARTALAMQIAPARTAGTLVSERFDVSLDGRALTDAVTEFAADHAGRIHLVRSDAGRLHLSYSATVRPAVSPVASGGPEVDAKAIVYLRQSRYCPSDELIGFAAAELRALAPGPDLARGIAEWVFERLVYDLDTSGPFTTAVDTLSANAGACRDFAHLTVALCRARGVPARLAAVYAPGLTPMDFHAVVEARVEGTWLVLDPTRRAPRSSLVRIVTGRDAADTAFATTLTGDAEMLAIQVTATTTGDLPVDDHTELVDLP